MNTFTICKTCKKQTDEFVYLDKNNQICMNCWETYNKVLEIKNAIKIEKKIKKEAE